MTGTEKIPRLWLPIAMFALLWADLVRELSSQWEAREQYAYGWFVPIFAVLLLWRRRAGCPPAARPRPSIVMNGIVLVLVLALLPMRVIYEINPDWPLLSWVYTIAVVAITLYAFYLAGGWPWVRNFAFPVALILVAVAWPWRIEKALTQNLMRIVAGLTVEVLGLFGVPAMRKGNLIELGTGVVGVDEACSGIRSFQSGVMAALVMGEFYRLRFRARLGMLGCGLALAFILNVARTFLLSWQANEHGLSEVSKWHDPAGLSTTVLCFIGLWCMGGLMRRKWSAEVSPSQLPAGGCVPAVFLWGVGCWVVCILALNECWYRAHEVKDSGVFRWSASFPTNNPTFAKLELSDKVNRNLRQDIGKAATWQENQGGKWTAFFFRWNPGPVSSIISARQHRPDICLPAAGLRQVADAGVNYFEVGGLRLPFREYTYSSSGTLLHVFFCQWEDGADRQMGVWGSSLADRVRAAISGRRNLGQQSLEMVLSGCPTLREAEQSLARQLPSIIRRDQS